MSHILICSTPALGHVAPLAAVATYLVQQGHHVRFLGGTKYADRIVATGATFIPLPPGADVDLDHPTADFPQRNGLTGLAVMKFDITNLFLLPVPYQFAALEEAIRAELTDAVLVEPMFLSAANLLSRPRSERPAFIGLGVVPLTIADVDIAPPGFGLPPLPGPFGRARNAVLAAIADRLIFRSVFRTARQLQHDSGADSSPIGFGWLGQADAVAQFTVSGFEYPRRVPLPQVHFVGPVSRTVASDAILPDWWHLLDDGKPVIHVTQGTVANEDFAQLIAPALSGLAEEDAHVVVSTGGRPVSELPHPLPGNVLAAEFLPYDLLLPRTSVMVTNGGYGGVHYALEYGVPLVVAGMTEDKPEVSARVAWTGAGINLRTNRPRPDKIRAAVRRVLSDGSYREASVRLSLEIAASPGLPGVEKLIEETIDHRTSVA